MSLIELIRDEVGKTSQTKVMGWLAFAVVSLILANMNKHAALADSGEELGTSDPARTYL